MSGGHCWQADEGIVAHRGDRFQRHVSGALDGPFVVLFEQDGADQAGIAASLGKMPPDLFALLDGALCDDLRFLLQINGLRGRPLFLEAGDADAIASGPFLVPLDSPEQVAGVIAISGQGRTPVIWSWPRGEAELYRHLRKQNMAEIPIDRAEVAETGEPTEPTHDSVIFRHWDPHVLGVTLPVFTHEQVARLMGPATGLAFAADGEGPVLRPGLPAPPVPPPPLRFSVEQMAGMEAGRGEVMTRNIARYLREAEPEAVAGLDQAGLLNFVRQSSARGGELGMSSEHALGLWSWLVLCTGGAAARSTEIATTFRQSGQSPNETMIALIDQMVEYENGAGRPS